MTFHFLHFSIKLEDLSILRTLGVGAFSSVKLAKSKKISERNAIDSRKISVKIFQHYDLYAIKILVLILLI